EALFAPLPSDEFFARYWQQKPLVAKGTQLEPLVGLADIEELISTVASLDGGWLILTKDGVPKPNSSVRNRNDGVDPAAVGAAYEEGYTLILMMVQQRWPAIRVLCRDLERDLLSRGVILSRSIR